MFKNIGGKIKDLAEILCWIGVILSVIIALPSLKLNILRGIITIVIGFLVSWLGTFLLYGFGELIEKTSETAKYTEFIAIKMGICSEEYDEEDIENLDET